MHSTYRLERPLVINFIGTFDFCGIGVKHARSAVLVLRLSQFAQLHAMAGRGYSVGKFILPCSLHLVLLLLIWYHVGVIYRYI